MRMNDRTTGCSTHASTSRRARASSRPAAIDARRQRQVEQHPDALGRLPGAGLVDPLGPERIGNRRREAELLEPGAAGRLDRRPRRQRSERREQRPDAECRRLRRILDRGGDRTRRARRAPRSPRRPPLRPRRRRWPPRRCPDESLEVARATARRWRREGHRGPVPAAGRAARPRATAPPGRRAARPAGPRRRSRPRPRAGPRTRGTRRPEAARAAPARGSRHRAQVLEPRPLLTEHQPPPVGRPVGEAQRIGQRAPRRAAWSRRRP